MELIDLVGRSFGLITAIKFIGVSIKNGERVWMCECGCGRRKLLTTRKIRRSKSCGCLNHRPIGYSKKPIMGRVCKPIDLTGIKIGKLSVIKGVVNETRKRSGKTYLCICDCGNEKIINSVNLLWGTKSCGCLQRPLPDAAYKLKPSKRNSKYLTDCYIKARISDQFGLKNKEITRQIINMKRCLISTKRELKKTREVANELFRAELSDVGRSD